MRLEGKRALATGAGSGGGRSTALLFAKEGARVAAADLFQAEAEATAAEIRKGGGERVALAADLGAPAQARTMVEEAIGALGGYQDQTFVIGHG